MMMKDVRGSCRSMIDQKVIPELTDLKTATGRRTTVTIPAPPTHTSGMGEASSEDAKKGEETADLIPVFAKKPLASSRGAVRYCQSGHQHRRQDRRIVSASYDGIVEKRALRAAGDEGPKFYPSAGAVARTGPNPTRAAGREAARRANVFILERARFRRAASVTRPPKRAFSTATDYAKFLRRS